MDTRCESCKYYEYDEEYECYTCQVTLDEDEMYHFMTRPYRGCPYYSTADDYAVVRHQM